MEGLGFVGKNRENSAFFDFPGVAWRPKYMHFSKSYVTLRWSNQRLTAPGLHSISGKSHAKPLQIGSVQTSSFQGSSIERRRDSTVLPRPLPRLGTTALVACRVALRGDPGRLPDSEHRVDER